MMDYDDLARQLARQLARRFFGENMMRIFFEFLGISVPKSRPRKGKGGHFYTPKKTQEFEKALKIRALKAMEGKKILKGPIVIHCLFYLPIPSSWSKRKKKAAELGKIVPEKRPDGDNLEKAVWDALSGVVYEDDSQIVDWYGGKRYSPIPRIEISISEFVHL